MYLTCLAQQVDIVGGDGNRHDTSVQNFTRKSGLTPEVMFTLNISMDLSILLLVLRWLD